MKYYILTLVLVPQIVCSQIADTSFFPNTPSLNPGVIHLRNGGIFTIEGLILTSEKKINVPNSTSPEESNSDVKLKNLSAFHGFSNRLISGEILYRNETGQKKSYFAPEGIKRNLNAKSRYIGGSIDFGLFGISVATSNFDHTNINKMAKNNNDVYAIEDINLNYKNFKLGHADKLGPFRLGFHFEKQMASGDLSISEFDAIPNAGLKTKYPLEIGSFGLAGGAGITLQKMRFEFSYEKIFSGDFKLASNYPVQITRPNNARRITAVLETKLFSWLSLGVRYRSIKGNYVDLEELITSNLLYSNVGKNDVRKEITYNFNFGDRRGLSPSLFFMTSHYNGMETPPAQKSTSEKFSSTTKTRHYGASLTYRF